MHMYYGQKNTRRGTKGPVKGPDRSPVSVDTARACNLGLRSKTGAFKCAMKTLLDDGLIEYTIPDKSNSRLQKYRLTGKGK